ncbi:MAG: UDP-N-acetylmuramate dehydrogenase [Patescibacteria group bacterium]
MNIIPDFSLTGITTFRLGGFARFFCEVKNIEDLKGAISFSKEKGVPFIVVGGGSNTLFRDDGFPGLVIKISFTGIEIVRSEDSVSIYSGAGENWDSLVMLAVTGNLSGIENLSGIPGTVGGALVQNIGAYGREIKDVFLEAEVFDAGSGELKKFSAGDCDFAYRSSIFKTNPHLIVLKVTLKLSVNFSPSLSYPDLRRRLESRPSPNLKEVREVVLCIRAEKLPDWRKIGTAGSFFKHPVVPGDIFRSLALKFPEVPLLREGVDTFKVPAGWLLDKVGGFKGVRRGMVGTAPRHALVIVAEPGAKSSEVVVLAEEMRQKIFEETGVTLEPEVMTPGVEWGNLQV